MNGYINIVDEISRKCKEIEENSAIAKNAELTEKTYFFENGNILAFPRDDGDSRYHYGRNGFNFWAYASGYMHSNDGLFTQFLKATEGQEPQMAFFACVPDESGMYNVVSLLPVPVLREEPAGSFKRYTVFDKACVHYITENEEFRFAVRVFADDENNLNYTVTVENLRPVDREIFISTYLNPFMRHSFSETVEDRWFREVRYLENEKSGEMGTFVFKVNEDISRTMSVSNYGVVLRHAEVGAQSAFVREEATTSRYQYVGGSRGSLHNPLSLYKGTFEKTKHVSAFTETAVAGDMVYLKVGASDTIRYDAYFCNSVRNTDQTSLIQMLSQNISAKEVDKKLEMLEMEAGKSEESMFLHVKESVVPEVKDEVFNHFFYHLKNQVEFCSLVKGYVQPYNLSQIGVRDVFQSLEGLLFYNPEASRAKILEAMDYVFVNGRCPRQYLLPGVNGESPAMDLRPFIDQGVWVISTIYAYLKATGDTSILEEERIYHEILDEKKGLTARSEEKDSVLDHMFRIMEYLLGNRDFENTGCIRALYGDWNDALDGLGVSNKPGVEYGTGVSVMVTLQTYQNLTEMITLLKWLGEEKYFDKIAIYEEAKEGLKESLNRYAIVQNENGERRILHGWGDERSYLVGSFDDPDHQSRHALTSNAFWVLSGMYDLNQDIKGTILHELNALDSKYGYKTFEPYFPANTPGVGRIPKLPAGTAENGASYIHATAFAAMALYRMGYPEKAWEQLVKIMPFTHDTLSHSPYVMPNSYVYNEDLQIDGESMDDWRTGSANVLLKTLIRYVFGVDPELNGVWIQTAGKVPFRTFEFVIHVKGCKINLHYQNNGIGERKYFVNGRETTGIYHEIMGIKRIWISLEELKSGEIDIEIED